MKGDSTCDSDNFAYGGPNKYCLCCTNYEQATFPASNMNQYQVTQTPNSPE